MKAVINISSDQIMIKIGDEERYLERNGVDVELGKVLVALDRQYDIKECIVLNGPGGFTNLRVGSLALNLLKVLKGGELRFFELSKPELYKAFYQYGLLPEYMVLYIGQKSNVWLRSLEQDQMIKVLKKQELATLTQELGSYAVDYVYDQEYFEDECQVSFSFDEEGVVLNWKDKTKKLPYAILPLRDVDSIQPNYMISPNVG